MTCVMQRSIFMQNNAFKAGLFIVISLMLGVAILIGIRGTETFFNPMREMTVAFDLTENVGGLKIGDTVRVGGVDQGRVKQIRFVESAGVNASPHFQVDFTLPIRFDLRRDAIIQVEQGLTGTSNLNISALGSAASLQEGDILDGQGGALARIIDDVPQIMQTLDATLAEAKQTIADVRQQVPVIVNRYDQTMHRADETLTNVRDLLGDTKTDIRTTLANLNSASNTLKDKMPVTIDKIDTFLTKTTQTVEEARGSLADIRDAAANIKDATSEAKSLLVRNRSRFDNIIVSLRNTSTNLETASSEIRRSPWRLLYQPKTEELSNLNIFDSARAFSQAATQLNDVASAIRDATQDNTTSPEQMKSLLQKLEESFNNYKDVETKLWNAVK